MDLPQWAVEGGLVLIGFVLGRFSVARSANPGMPRPSAPLTGHRSRERRRRDRRVHRRPGGRSTRSSVYRDLHHVDLKTAKGRRRRARSAAAAVVRPPDADSNDERADGEAARRPRRSSRASIARYTPAVATRARAALKTMRALYPGATQLVYDNYNALCDRVRPDRPRGRHRLLDHALSEVGEPLLHARHRAPRSRAAARRAAARGSVTSSSSARRRWTSPAVRALIRQALEQARPRPPAAGALVIKSVSKKQRPRRPPA